MKIFCFILLSLLSASAASAQVYVTPTGVSTTAVYQTPGAGGFDGPNGGALTTLDIGLTVNDYFNGVSLPGNNFDGIRFSTDGPGALNPEFVYSVSVPQVMNLVAFELFPTVGGSSVEEVRAYSVEISLGGSPVFSGSYGVAGDTSSGNVGSGNSIDVAANLEVFTPGNTYAIRVVDLSGPRNNREFSEVRLRFDVVPEPSISLFLGVCSVFLMHRRR